MYQLGHSPTPTAAHPAGVIDIGGSHITAAIVELDPTPRVLARSGAAIDTHGAREKLLGALHAAVSNVAASAERWTIAMPGPFDYERGIGTFDGVAKFSTLAGLDLRAQFSSMLGIDQSRVSFINDAIAYGTGEWFVSDARPARFVCITLGTGVGSAFLDGGRPVEEGRSVPPHGWAHLLEVGGAPLEDAVSTRAIRRRYAEAGGDDLSVREIAGHARAGESRASTVLTTAMHELGEALGPWIERFHATEVVVGGSMSRSWDLLGAAFEDGLRDHRVGTATIRPSVLFDDAPLVGCAASVALRH
ncbi:ROK family protein [Gryllotalpicola reticulitermitis]|uniref:ROK family protein n=1 Tax=Gryllotalpicola reticulitermitis TaxID=1184153 RepID=A0ABV8QA16_9MICO